jgi:hypothetical protein
MLGSDVPLHIVLPREAPFCATESIAATGVITVKTAAIMLGLMPDEVFLQRERNLSSCT